MLTGLKMRIQQSDDFQTWFNKDLTPEQRETWFFKEAAFVEYVISKHKLTVVCDDCWAIMDIFYNKRQGCVECGRHNLSSE